MNEEKVASNTEVLTPEEISNIRVIKLSSGEEVIGVMVGLYPDEKIEGIYHLLVKRPCKFYGMNQPDGSYQFVLNKYVIFSDSELHAFSYHNVISYSRVNKETEKFFIKTIEKQIRDETSEFIGKQPKELEWPDIDFENLKPNQIN